MKADRRLIAQYIKSEHIDSDLMDSEPINVKEFVHKRWNL